MLKQWLSRLETVHVATTREEKEAVYRFRYQIYAEEFGRELGSPDHACRWVRDDDDDRPYSTILYTGTPDRITGTVRLRHWAAGDVPHHDFEELSMDRIPSIETRNTAEIGRLMVRRSKRGRLVIASLLRASYERLAGEHQTELTFCYCSPGLVRYYQHLAMRPFGGRLVHAPDGLMVPLVAVMSDRAYYRSVRSFLAPLVRRHFGPGKRQPTDVAPFEALFADGACGLEYQADRVCDAVDTWLPHGTQAHAASLLASLDDETGRSLIGRGLVLDVPRGTLVTRQGFHERELYVVLDGTFDSRADGTAHGRTLGRGQLFGESAFLGQGARTASVTARTDGRLLVLIGRQVEKQLRRDRHLRAPVMRYLATVQAVHHATAA